MRDLGLSLALLSSASMCSATGNGGSVGLQIIDEFTSPGALESSVDQVSNKAFRAFISTALAELSRQGFAISPTAELKFIRIALVASGNQVPEIPTALSLADRNMCRVESPWIAASVAQNGSEVSGTIFWSERQILHDKAELGGIKLTHGSTATLPREEFNTMSERYTQAMLNPSSTSPNDIPQDLLWLFRKSPQSTRGPFASSADASMRSIAQESAPFYGEVIAKILSLCRERKTNLKLESILELSELLKSRDTH